MVMEHVKVAQGSLARFLSQPESVLKHNEKAKQFKSKIFSCG